MRRMKVEIKIREISRCGWRRNIGPTNLNNALSILAMEMKDYGHDRYGTFQITVRAIDRIKHPEGRTAIMNFHGSITNAMDIFKSII